MRLAVVSPLPPTKTGIADYTAALVPALEEIAAVQVFSSAGSAPNPAEFDEILYQLGNNPFHGFVYEQALRCPGVAVLHEPNLHHLVADLTIGRGNWEGYLREAEYEGGPAALAHALQVKAGDAGPDYQGLPMLRRLLERSRAVVVHSNFAEREVRRAGFQGPVGRIPHGTWLEAADRMAYRERLGVDAGVPLVGIFGFLKPYKRIAECLRAFSRVRRLVPQAKMILGGEPHPDLRLDPLIRSLSLWDSVRLLGFVPPEDLPGYMAACDIVLNLRWPTAGETSGTLMRALGLARAVLVSDIGAFQELPDEVCLKVPVDEGEEQVLFEYLNLLVSRPELGQDMGRRARAWVERECAWRVVAQKYLEFLGRLTSADAPAEEKQPVQGAAAVSLEGSGAGDPPALAPETTAVPDTTTANLEDSAAGDVLAWAPESGPAREYVEAHVDRLERTLQMIPPGEPGARILEMGAYLHITPLLRTRLNYEEVRGCYLGPAGQSERRKTVSATGEEFECEIDLFDAERDPFPYPDGHFTTVLCCEVLEHLAADPMHMMAEINRVLKHLGHLVLTTPNAASLRSAAAVLQGYHPGLFPVYLRPGEAGADPRHHREYTPAEIRILLEDAGFEVTRLETGPYREAPRPELAWVRRLLERWRLPADLRGDAIYAVGRKEGPVRRRYPEWLYSGREK